MNRPWARKDAEAFAHAFDGRGPRDSEVDDLVRLAESLCEAAVEPSSEFTASLRTQLMTDASTVLVKAPSRPHTTPAPRPVRRRLAVATAGLVATGGFVGIVSSSASALPGEMLYPIKLSVESVKYTMKTDDVSRGTFELSQATRRLAEATQLAARDDARADELVAQSLNDFSEKAASGSRSLFSDYSEAGSSESIEKVSDFATQSSTVLSAISDQLSTKSAGAYQDAAATITGLAERASDMCSACAEAETSSLARAVGDAARALAITNETPTSSTIEKTASPVTVAPPAKSGSTSSPPADPAASLPTPELPADDIGEATQPIVGALLGDDEQVGLVPGLLIALLGGKK